MSNSEVNAVHSILANGLTDHGISHSQIHFNHGPEELYAEALSRGTHDSRTSWCGLYMRLSVNVTLCCPKV